MFGSSMPWINHDSVVHSESRIFNVAMIGLECAGKSSLIRLLLDKASFSSHMTERAGSPAIEKGYMLLASKPNVYTTTMSTTTYAPVDPITDIYAEVLRFIANLERFVIQPVSPDTAPKITVNFVDTLGFHDSKELKHQLKHEVKH